jgi:hypothetical protein
MTKFGVLVRGGVACTANAFQNALAWRPLLIAAAVVTIYLVPSMLYERLSYLR